MDGFDYSQFKKWVAKVGVLETEFQIWLKQFLLEQAQRVVREAKLRTPVKTGFLRMSYNIGQEAKVLRANPDGTYDDSSESYDSVFAQRASVEDIKVVGGIFYVTINNSAEYASDVEYGHKQTPGRYVPAIGKRLVKSWVPGRYMLTISVDEVQKAMPTRFEREFQQFLSERGFGK